MQLNLDSSEPFYVCVPYMASEGTCFYMEGVGHSLPSVLIVFVVASSLTTLSVVGSIPTSTPITYFWGIPPVFFMTLSHFSPLSMSMSSSNFKIRVDSIYSQSMGARIFTPNAS